MQHGGVIEEQYLHSINHVIGRTRWDHDHVWAINENVKYHFCNETLRKSFYTSNKWM